MGEGGGVGGEGGGLHSHITMEFKAHVRKVPIY